MVRTRDSDQLVWENRRKATGRERNCFSVTGTLLAPTVMILPIRHSGRQWHQYHRFGKDTSTQSKRIGWVPWPDPELTSDGVRDRCPRPYSPDCSSYKWNQYVISSFLRTGVESMRSDTMLSLRQFLVFSLVIMPILAASWNSSHPTNCTNTPHSRSCWIDGFDINTDYNEEVPPGKLVEVCETHTLGNNQELR